MSLMILYHVINVSLLMLYQEECLQQLEKGELTVSVGSESVPASPAPTSSSAPTPRPVMVQEKRRQKIKRKRLQVRRL